MVFFAQPARPRSATLFELGVRQQRSCSRLERVQFARLDRVVDRGPALARQLNGDRDRDVDWFYDVLNFWGHFAPRSESSEERLGRLRFIEGPEKTP
jgi:hypothetical protein